jgi:hypothetical protein
MSPKTTPNRSRSSFARVGVAGLTAVALSLAAAQPARAEPAYSGQVGSYTTATCGWYPADETLFDLAPRKRVRATLPSVSGVFAGQLVWARVQFMQPDANAQLVTYRTGWFYTYASPGQLTTSWTSYSAGGSGYTFVEDEGAESGYASGDSQNPVTTVHVMLYWITGSDTTGMADEMAQNAASAQDIGMCNGGGTLF